MTSRLNPNVDMTAMPLRIAVFALPPALTLKGALTKINLPYLSLIDAKIDIIHIELNQFEDDLNLAITSLNQDPVTHASHNHALLNQNKVIYINNQDHGLLLLPALKAAQLKWHSHGLLSSFQASSLTGVQTPLPNPQRRAIAQAKIAHREEDIKSQTFHELNSHQKFNSLIAFIHQLTTRTYQRDNHSAFWFSAPFKGRLCQLNFIQEAAHHINDALQHSSVNTVKQTTNTLKNNNASTSIVLAQGSYIAPAKPLLHHQRLFFILTAKNKLLLQQALNRLQHAVKQKNSHIVSLMQKNLQAYELTFTQTTSIKPIPPFNNKPSLTLVLQAKSVDELQQEITAMLTTLNYTDQTQSQYKTPAGSVFSPKPLGEKGLTFVYPGVGTVYPNMFNDLHTYFPDFFAQQEQESDLSAMLQAEKIYTAHHPVSNQITTTSKLGNMSLAELAIAGVGSSYLLTQLLMDVFKIKPKLSLGYSMGEAAMWASLKIWKNPHTLINKTLTDPLFTSMISGELTTVKKAWQREADAEQRTPAQTNHQPIRWNSFLVRAHADEINPLLPQYPHAYLAIIQGDTCIISGCETQCLALLKKLGKRGIPTHRVTAMHTVPAMDVHSDVAAFYHLALNEQAQGCADSAIRFISAAQTLPLTWAPQGKVHSYAQAQAISSEKIAQTLADTFCQPMDFPALINKAKKHGATLFVEVGADRQNTTLIDKLIQAPKQINRHQTSANPADTHEGSHALAINGKGGDTIGDLLKALAQLISHRVPVSIRPLLMSFQLNAPQPSSDHIFNKGEANVFS
ncbi:PfaB family protein [Shewanella surugensis]|uniref:PfaB family protein n=1 Tax=Shewanella surugensis TaxID=212020 RepID=A0ABT0L7Y9_9GAMM|nr:PfaB family protein [Shewanella surugensis]MCL1123492.1 PfaB family protein [Shewanella surugensis]